MCCTDGAVTARSAATSATGVPVSSAVGLFSSSSRSEFTCGFASTAERADRFRSATAERSLPPSAVPPSVRGPPPRSTSSVSGPTLQSVRCSDPRNKATSPGSYDIASRSVASFAPSARSTAPKASTVSAASSSPGRVSRNDNIHSPSRSASDSTSAAWSKSGVRYSLSLPTYGGSA